MCERLYISCHAFPQRLYRSSFPDSPVEFNVNSGEELGFAEQQNHLNQ
jgi:hypothetical protein